MEQIRSTTSKRKWKQLTEKDRYRLEAYFNTGMRTQEIAERMGYSKRTIECERALGFTEQLKPASKNIKTCSDLPKQWVCLADVAQRRHEENNACKGEPLKIGNDHRRLMESKEYVIVMKTRRLQKGGNRNGADADYRRYGCPTRSCCSENCVGKE